MADDMTYPTPPQPTAIPGTGSAVQVADMDGVKWKFDDQGGNWVNLETGEAVTPKTFAQMAGRSGDAARDTMALAQAMRREEAALTPPPRSPIPRPAAPPVALAPPTTQTATLPPAPIASPQATPILPPPQRYSEDELKRVQGQVATPSQYRPPSEAAQTFYKMQQVDWLMRNRGMKPADAMKMVGIGQAPMNAYQQARIGIEQQKLQQQRPMTANQQALDQHRRARLDFDKQKFDRQIALDKGKWSTRDLQEEREISTRIATIQKQLDTLDRPETLGPADQSNKERLLMEYESLIDDRTKLARKYESSATTPTPLPVTKPTVGMAGMSAAVPLPADKRNLVAGRTYNTKRGLAKWDGEKFIPIE